MEIELHGMPDPVRIADALSTILSKKFHADIRVAAKGGEGYGREQYTSYYDTEGTSGQTA